jgi:hypothetical protein
MNSYSCLILDHATGKKHHWIAKASNISGAVDSCYANPVCYMPLDEIANYYLEVIQITLL